MYVIVYIYNMESVVLLGLMGVGYLMNKDKDDKHKAYPEVRD